MILKQLLTELIQRICEPIEHNAKTESTTQETNFTWTALQSERKNQEDDSSINNNGFIKFSLETNSQQYNLIKNMTFSALTMILIIYNTGFLALSCQEIISSIFLLLCAAHEHGSTWCGWV